MTECIFCIKTSEGIILRNKELSSIFTHLDNFSKTHFYNANIIRFCYKIRYAKFKTPFLVITFRCRCSNKNRNGRQNRISLNFLKKFKAVNYRHIQIKNDSRNITVIVEKHVKTDKTVLRLDNIVVFL